MDLSKLENLQRTYTRKIREAQGLNFWNRLKGLGLNSEDRGIKTKYNSSGGRQCEIAEIAKKSSQRIQTLKENSFTVNGHRHFNSLPKKLRNMTKCSVDEFKFQLDDFLKTIPDQPKTPGMEPEAMNQYSAKPSNLVIDHSCSGNKVI